MFIPTQFEFDFEKIHIDSEYYMIIRSYLDELKDLLCACLNEFVNVEHSNGLKVENDIKSVFQGYDSNDIDTITYSTYDNTTEISLSIRGDAITVKNFNSKGLSYGVVDDFINKFIYRVRRLYDIKIVKCPNITNPLLMEWIGKNGGVISDRQYEDVDGVFSVLLNNDKEIDGEVLIDSIFLPDDYNIGSRRKTFKYIADNVGYILISMIEKHIKQIVKIKIDCDYEPSDECDEEYVGGISFMSYSGEVLYLEFFVDEVNIVLSDKIDDVNVFLDNSISEIVNLSKYFVDVDKIYVRSLVNDDVINWCSGAGFNREESEDNNWCCYNFTFSKYDDINQVRKHPYKTILLDVTMNECDIKPSISAYASLLYYKLEELSGHHWISAIENNRYNSKYDNHCRELKVFQSDGKDCQSVVAIQDELDNFIITDCIKVTSSYSNMTVYIDNSVDYIILRASKTARTLTLFNINKELLLSLFLTGNEYSDVVYDVKNNSYISDDDKIKEMIIK